jgi:hypothetical protein
MQLVQNPATGVYTLVQPATGVPGSEFIHQHQQSSFQGTAAMEYGHPPPPATVIFQQQPQSSSSSNAAVGSGGGKPQNFECVSGKPLNNEQQPSSASSDIQIIGASSGSHQQPQQMKVMVSVRRPNTRATARRRGQPPTSPNILAPSLNATTTTIPLLPISAPTPTTAMTLAGNKHAQTQQNPHVLVGEQMFAPAAKTRQIAMEKRSTHNQQQLQVPVPVTVITLDHQCQPVTNSGSSMPPSPQKATTSSAAATAGCGGGSLSESQEFKVFFIFCNLLN